MLYFKTNGFYCIKMGRRYHMNFDFIKPHQELNQLYNICSAAEKMIGIDFNACVGQRETHLWQFTHFDSSENIRLLSAS